MKRKRIANTSPQHKDIVLCSECKRRWTMECPMYAEYEHGWDEEYNDAPFMVDNIEFFGFCNWGIRDE